MEKIQIIVEGFEDLVGDFPLWSKFYVKGNQFFFPSQNWYDATTSLLTMWTEAINHLLLNTSASVTLYFLDGDFSITLVSQNGICAHASFSQPNSSQITNEIIDLRYFSRQLLAAVEKTKCQYIQHPNNKAINDMVYQAEKLRTTLRKKQEKNNKE